jgi:hypothetical protein
MTTVMRFRRKPGTEDVPGHVQVQVFVGHGIQDDPSDITAGLAGELLMDEDEWSAISRRFSTEATRRPEQGVAFAVASRLHAEARS